MSLRHAPHAGLLQESRPPAAGPGSLLQRLLGWFDAQLDPQATRPLAGDPARRRWQRRPNARTLQAQRDFAAELADIPSDEAVLVRHAIRCAASLHDLWHVRAELFHVVARHHDQAQAQQRLARLARHFPTRAPRSGLVPLEGTPSTTRQSL